MTSWVTQNGIGRSSAAGKFDGVGAAYNPYARPGFAYVENDPVNDNFNIHLSGLNDHGFTYTKTTDSRIREFTKGVGTQYHSQPSQTAKNSIPEFYETPENWYEIRNEYYNNGMVAYKFSNDGEPGQYWKSNIEDTDVYTYAWGPPDNPLAVHPDVAAGEYRPTFLGISASNSDKMTFSLDDDNLGMYLYSKASGYPLAELVEWQVLLLYQLDIWQIKVTTKELQNLLCVWNHISQIY